MGLMGVKKIQEKEYIFLYNIDNLLVHIVQRTGPVSRYNKKVCTGIIIISERNNCEIINKLKQCLTYCTREEILE
jgi:hypothetical protein